MTLTFTIPGNPVPKGRPRAFKDGRGHIRIHTPKETVKAEARARFWMRDDLGAKSYPVFPAGGVSVDLAFFLETPGSWTSRKRDLAEGAGCIGRSDVDNLAKMILDAMNGLIFTDDRQIVSLKIEKHYSREPRTEITVSELAADSHDGCQDRPKSERKPGQNESEGQK